MACVAADPAWSSDVNCGNEGDAAGWALATDGDFDGDGVVDIAVGAPCSRVSGQSNVGRVFVHSGATGRRLLTLKGSLKNQKFGGALAFVADLSGDGHADLVVGSPGWSPNQGTPQERSAAGKVSVFSSDAAAIFELEGDFSNGNLGEAVAAILDGNGDGVADIVVGAGGDRIVNGGDRFGAVYLVSGATGQMIDSSYGEIRFDQWGAVLSSAGDVDGDGWQDVLVSTNLADRLPDGATQSEENNGLVRIISGASFADVIAEARGNEEDKLGKSSSMAGDFDRDGVLDFVGGAPGVTVGNKGNAGEIAIFSGATGARLKTITEPVPQAGGTFGAAVVGVGRIDSDKVPDVVGSAPAALINGFSNVGRVHMFSAAGGGALWSLEGTFPGTRLGHALNAIVDLDHDGYTDVVIGSPGDAFRGKRGAGSVRVVSGKTGATLQTFGGRVGIETRIFTAGWTIRGDAEVRSVTSTGRTARPRQDVLRGVRDGSFSIAVVDEASDIKLAVAAARGSTEPWVEVKRARRRRGVLSRFLAAFSGPYSGGVNVAGGKLTADPGEELAVVQAESDTGDVELSLYARVDTDPFGRITWGRKATFPVFAAADTIDGFVVDADGATVAVGAVTTGDDRIVVGSVGGTPVVRVFNALGQMEAQWLVYPAVSASGASVAIGNIDSGGFKEIVTVTVPQSGQLRVRAFNASGTPFVSPDTGSVVDFVVPASVVGSSSSFQVAVADVDLDNRGEILIVPESGFPCHIVAFEADGSLVAGWPATVFPYWPVTAGRIAIATTDRFLTRN